MKNNSNCLPFVAKQLIFCWANTIEYIRWNLTVQMNVRIYSWGKNSIEWISKYVTLKKSKNIWRFEYIQIFIEKYVHLPKYSWIFSKWIYLDIHSILFFLMNIFGRSFGLLDSNEYIRLYWLNKILVVSQQMVGN